MSIRTAAREVVAACALAKEGTQGNGGWGGYLTQGLSDAIARLQKVLDVSADADALGAEMNARRRDDDAEKMKVFRHRFETLVVEYSKAAASHNWRYMQAASDELLKHVFGESE